MEEPDRPATPPVHADHHSPAEINYAPHKINGGSRLSARMPLFYLGVEMARCQLGVRSRLRSPSRVEPGAREVGVGDVRALESGAAQVRIVEMSRPQLRPFEGGVLGVHPAQRCRRHRRAVQARIDQRRAVERRLPEICVPCRDPVEIRGRQVRLPDRDPVDRPDRRGRPRRWPIPRGRRRRARAAARDRAPANSRSGPLSDAQRRGGIVRGQGAAEHPTSSR